MFLNFLFSLYYVTNEKYNAFDFDCFIGTKIPPVNSQPIPVPIDPHWTVVFPCCRAIPRAFQWSIQNSGPIIREQLVNVN